MLPAADVQRKRVYVVRTTLPIDNAGHVVPLAFLQIDAQKRGELPVDEVDIGAAVDQGVIRHFFAVMRECNADDWTRDAGGQLRVPKPSYAPAKAITSVGT